MVGSRGICSVLSQNIAVPKKSLGCFFPPQKKTQAMKKKRSLRFKLGKRSRVLLGLVLIAVVLTSIVLFTPRGNDAAPGTIDPVSTASPSATPGSSEGAKPSGIEEIIKKAADAVASAFSRPPGIIESAETVNSTLWLKIAKAAWLYYAPGTGVDLNTGIPWTGTASPYITDWDVGAYIQAVVDAAELGLVKDGGDWGVDARMDKVLTFLETRELNSAGYPYQFYQATDGQVWHENSDKMSQNVDAADTGRMLVALNNLRNYNSSLASRINNIVLYGQLYNRSNYAALVPSINAECATSTSIYTYYIASGFAAFWPNELSSAPGRVLDNMLSSGNVTTKEGATLPLAKISCDPLLCSVFELENDNRLMTLMNQVYTAHETYWHATNKYRAFGEGPTISTGWQWEWVVLPDGRTWTVLNGDGTETGTMPMIYTKIALGFFAINNTAYTKTMAVFLEQNIREPLQGYEEGFSESKIRLDGSGSLTNSLIIGAALYYIQHNP